MIEPLRSAFNAAWTERAYEIVQGAPGRVGRVARSASASASRRSSCRPTLRDAMVQGALEIWDQLLQPAALERSKAAVPPEFDVPASDDHPLFAAGRLRDRRGGRPPRAPAHRAAGLPLALRLPAPPGAPVPRDGARARGAARVPPERPRRRAATGAWWATRSSAAFPPRTSSSSTSTRRGRAPTRTSRPPRSSSGSAPSARPTSTKRGRELWYERDGKKTRILRVYNRLIVDELVEKKVRAALPLHGRARRAVGGPPELVLPLEQARAAGAAPPARARGAAAERLRPRPGRPRRAGC